MRFGVGERHFSAACFEPRLHPQPRWPRRLRRRPPDRGSEGAGRPAQPARLRRHQRHSIAGIASAIGKILKRAATERSRQTCPNRPIPVSAGWTETREDGELGARASRQRTRHRHRCPILKLQEKSAAARENRGGQGQDRAFSREAPGRARIRTDARNPYRHPSLDQQVDRGP